ncbi:Lrp/AsnC family transcriptional regulator, leucine-responsive regulatory protein [Oceanospirillum multiglobuliferum]|uniref:Leucine-responsive regulatory protein n=1 Tax=Oceanospirillum multiglobuliferum TaxID=64969 RepID=A0A1T4QK52_9GAMM|nr:winged helix-turn-helix transcriptional regulator [Oceanospirillum multiglobuliferum]OPX56415.1 proline dehydrogenase transcriptional activator [Oceanospirillum multiglobuliferum]SKA04170.1 Lrp/AsnC family transcriptional regulator, leucine-responsive regulatory protein [Oceanospirillum multiglobuliferum]
MKKNEQLDRIDHAILRELQKDARLTVTELASRVGLSKTPCQLRIKKLEEQGYILGYVALINQTKLGASHVAFVQVKLGDTKSKALEAFNTAVREIPEVEQCHMISAGFDYLLKVRTSGMEAYRKVLGEQISALPYVLQTSTFAVMESVKDIENHLLEKE